MLSVFDRSKTTEALIRSRPQKTALPGGTGEPLPRCSPEQVGISSGILSRFVLDLARDPELNIHGIMAAKDGKVIAESYAAGYSPGDWHSTFSLCKTVTGIAAGLLWDQGKLDLDAPVQEFFPEHRKGLLQRLQPDIKVRHLLAMQSGVEFAEFGAVTSEDWVSSFLSSSLRFDPGKKFNYNSMNSYMLAAIICGITGEGLVDFLRPRLFQPLGMGDCFWERCPKGIEKGGFGMYLRLEDMTKLGILLMNGGEYQGRRILSEKWVREMTSRQSGPDSDNARFDYGYQVWVGRRQNSFLLNGLFGQNALGFRDSGLIISAIAGSCESFQEGRYFDVVEKHFSGRNPGVGPGGGSGRLRSALRELRDKNLPLHSPASGRLGCYLRLKQLEKAEFRPASPEPSLGLMPLLSCMFQNIYPSGIDGFRLLRRGSKLILQMQESGRRLEIPCGLLRPVRSVQDFGGEPYILSCSARLGLDQDRCPVVRLRLDFVETVSSRLITLTFRGDSVQVTLAELPDYKVVEMVTGQLLNELPGKRLLGSLAARFGTDFVRFKLQQMMQPEFIALPKL